ncbi:hypothetical protein G6F22_010628 [Rhizopus arrhizus]|nr:hypothetical protein G6F22_010628 [Rhizopus arrhizus]KAG0784661.1 hypothetical protein G6F21_009762 [Rhizopus arrhizus]KAG0896178.1 hypothetical protein G6F34_007584 [Rhizopus arrhizus]KAG0911017.1 hypothetical protein G6F33_007368 [Rhizopus arrhizus]KAG0961958.1 hypothetical protein G6F31_009139 [Rhizopus arrhizus]
MGTPDNRKYAADESPEINVVNKIKDCLPSYRSLRVPQVVPAGPNFKHTNFSPLTQFDAAFVLCYPLMVIRSLIFPHGSHATYKDELYLNDLTWSLILHETTDVGTVDDTPFVSWFTRSSYWYLFDSKVLCLNQLSSLLPYSFSTWSSQKWQQFWSLEIAPEVRSLWYRFFYNKLHCQVTVSRFDPQVTAMCNFCQDAPEDLRHLFVDCHQKWSIWQTVLSQFAPYLEFQQDDVYAILMNLLQNIYIY